MPLVNISKPSTTILNTTKVSVGETWATIQTTWATETRTWEAVSQLITNTRLENVDFLWGTRSAPWTYLLPWQVNSGMTNLNKPI